MSDSGFLEQPIEEWPYLDQEVLLHTRSRKVCMTCHWFRHHAGVTASPCSPASCTRDCSPRASTSLTAVRVGPTT